YGDAVTESAETQLLHFKESLSKELQPYPRLKKAPVVQVETSQAMQYFRNDDIKTWRESGFEEFTSVISEVINDLGYQFSLLNLRRTVDEVQLLNQILINSFKEKAEKEESLKDQTAYLNELQKICSAIQEDRDRITGVWGNRLLYYPVFRKYKSELSRIYNDIYDFNPSQDRDFIAKVHDLGERAQRLKDSFLNSLDRAKSRYSVRFRELGLDVRRQDLQKIDRTSFFLPNVQKKSRLEKLAEPDHAVHFSGLSLWNDNGTDGEDKYFDQTRYYEDLKESLKNFFEPLLKHLQWWEQTVNYTFIEPLQKKIQTLKEDEETILAGIEIDESSFEELSNISTELEAAANSVAGLCGIDPLKHRVDKYAGYAQKAELQKHGAVDSNLFADIYKRISENQFHGYYLSCLSELSVSKDKQILIITQGYSSTVNFLRRLLRLDNDQLALLSEIKPPFCINVQDSIPELYNIEIKGDLQNSLSFYILGNDIESYDAAEVYDLFEKSDIIQVMIEDLHRVGSAATDLTERNIFLTAMNRYCKKLLMTYPKAAYFQGERLHILVNEAVAEINSIFSITSLQWFIYENFEVRYSQFNRLTSEAGYKIDPESFIKEWKKRLIPLDAPFDETLLRKQVKELTNG
nr:hypothetical protein [bacterium]